MSMVARRYSGTLHWMDSRTLPTECLLLHDAVNAEVALLNPSNRLHMRWRAFGWIPRRKRFPRYLVLPPVRF